MNNKAKIEKGNRFVRYLEDLFRRELDANARATKGSGNGLNKGDLRLPSFNLDIEAKNQDSFNLISDWEQTEQQRTAGNKSMLIIRHPRYAEFRKVLVVMDLNDFIEIMQGQGGDREVSMKLPAGEEYRIRRWLDEGKRILKVFE